MSFTGRSGAHIFHDLLREQGVEVLFGYPGAAVIPIFDVLYESPIRYIQSRHEQGAVHMADGYARATGKPGVCIATSGPGATNLVTGIATANMDSIPMVAITGQVKSTLLGNDAFQEVDMTGITRPITKYNRQVTNVADLPRAIREAFHIATTGRPGPVVVDICVDATTATLDGEVDTEISLPGYRPVPQISYKQVQAVANAINAAKRPVLYVGGGVIAADAFQLVRQLAEKAHIPTTTTLLGLGAFDEMHPLALRMLGMHGSAVANMAVQSCDCLIAIGARFDDRVTGNVKTFAPHATIIHIDVDPSSIGKTVAADIPCVGDAKAVLAQLLPLVQPAKHVEWLEQVAGWKQQYPFRYHKSAQGHIKPQQVIETLARLTNHEAIICTGVGQHQMWTAQYYGFRRPRQLISSGGLGTMGFGVPAAIGAQLACPGATVVDIDGDGSFSMTMNEVITAVRYQIPVKYIVMDNTYLGMVRQWQQLFWDRRYSGVEQMPIDFAAIAKAYGAAGFSAESADTLEDAIAALLRHDGPAVLHARVEREENVYPMVPAGAALHEMRLGTLA
jgi:acetolactate synthase-1/2/3 large subunit